MNLPSFVTCVATLISSAAIAGDPSFTKGAAQVIDPGLFDCGSKDRISAVGMIQSDDGINWTVPAEVSFATAAKAADLYNECADVTPSKLSAVDFSKVPILDAGGSEEFVAYIFADNYFELYVNGKLIAVDAIPFTPFNSSIVRFRADRPLTVAVKLVDWEEDLGLGTEKNQLADSHAGDGGVTLHIKNAAKETVALSDESWRAQTFYISPLLKKSCLSVEGEIRDSSACATADIDIDSGGDRYAAHWTVPGDWMNADFNDKHWPFATSYTNETVGVRNKPGFMNFTDVFDAHGADAKFIWSSNLVLDNLVLIRKTIE